MTDRMPESPAGRGAKLTSEQRALFMAVEDVLQRHSVCFDDLCDTYAAAFRADADADPDDNPAVKDCLYSAADHLQQAGMDWYVSTK